MRNLIPLSLLCLLAGCSSSPPNHNYIVVNPADGNGEILVDLKDNVSDADIKEVASIAHTTFHENNKVAHQFRYESATVNPTEENDILIRLKQDPRVEHAEPLMEYQALFTPNDPMFGDQWGMKRVGAETAWGMSCGQGVVVSVLDTGSGCHLSDAPVKCSEGFSAVNDDGKDRHGHSAHVGGTIAQNTNNNFGATGLAYCATVLPVKVLTDGGFGTNEGIAEGIRWAADNGANVINMSLGGPYPSDIIEDAVNYAHDKGVSVVCAAGNSGGSVGYPAAFKNSIAISALDKDDNLARFSSRGPEVALSMPGVDILQQTIGGEDGKGDFKKFSGTSMASPAAAAEAALIYSSGITDPDSIKSKMQSTADPKDNPNLFGAGVGRPDSAVRSTFLWHTITRLLALFGVLFFLRKSVNLSSVKNWMTISGMVFTGFGLVPLLFTGLLPYMGSFRIVGELLARPFGEWDLVLGLFSHKYLLFANFVPAGLATLLMLNNRLRYLAGGLALGTAALCGQMAISGDTAFFAGGLLMRVYMAVSVFVCCYLAKSAFEKKLV